MKLQPRHKTKINDVVEVVRQGVAEGARLDLQAFVTAFDTYRATGLDLVASAFTALLQINSAGVRVLSDRIAALEEKATVYRGVHQHGLTYAKGDQVTRQGGLWLAQCETRQAPGAASSDWKLIVKKGRAE